MSQRVQVQQYDMIETCLGNLDTGSEYEIYWDVLRFSGTYVYLMDFKGIQSLGIQEVLEIG